MGVDFLSFPTAQVDPKTFQEITAWVAGPKFGIEAENFSSDLLNQYPAEFMVIKSTQLGVVLANDLSGIKLIVSLAATEWAATRVLLLKAEEKIMFIELIAFSLDAVTSTMIDEVAKDFEILLKLSGPISPGEILKLPIAGISLDGNAETKPGLKEYPLAEILEKLAPDDTD